jgi:hypothetical protein
MRREGRWLNILLRWQEEGMSREGRWENTVKMEGRRNEEGRRKSIKARGN